MHPDQSLSKTAGWGTLPNSFCEAAITMIPKPTEIPHRKENNKTVSLMNIDAKILKNKKEKKNATLEGSYTKFKWNLSQGCEKFSLYANQKIWDSILTNWKIKIIW